MPSSWRYLTGVFLTDLVETSVNTCVIEMASAVVLIDTRARVLMGAELGHLATQLSAGGYQPDRIDDIVLAHLDPNHIGGLVAAGQPAFPREAAMNESPQVAL